MQTERDWLLQKINTGKDIIDLNLLNIVPVSDAP